MTSYLIYMSINLGPSDNLSYCIGSMYRSLWVSNYGPGATSGLPPIFINHTIKMFYWITAKPIHLQTIYRCFCVMTLEPCRREAGHLATKPEVFTIWPSKETLWSLTSFPTLMFPIFLQSAPESQWPLKKNHSCRAVGRGRCDTPLQASMHCWWMWAFVWWGHTLVVGVDLLGQCLHDYRPLFLHVASYGTITEF